MVGLNLDAARKRLKDAGFQVADQPTPVNNLAARGVVVGTTPTGQALPGSTITINTSTGFVPAPVYTAPPPVEDNYEEAPPPPPPADAPPPDVNIIEIPGLPPITVPMLPPPPVEAPPPPPPVEAPPPPGDVPPPPP